MKYIKYTLLVAFALFIPFMAFAVPTSVDRITNRIEPLIKTDFMRALYFTASSTTATSSFPNASTTNLTILGKLYDRLLSAGTNGYVLQTNGTGITWVATSSLGITGSGGSGNSAFTIGNGLIYNATSTDLVGIGTTTPSTTLFVQGKGGTNPFTIASSTGTNILVLTQAGFFGLGVASPDDALDVSGSVGIVDVQTGNTPTMKITNTQNSGDSGAGLQLQSDDGAQLVADDRLGYLAFAGARNSSNSIIQIARIEGRAAGPIASGNAPSYLTFLTTATTTANPVEVVRISPEGYLLVGTTTASHRLNVAGTANISGALTLPSLSDGCAQLASGVLTSTGSACGSAGGTLTWVVDNGFLRTSTTTDYAKAAYFLATSTTASTFPNASTTNTTVTSNLYLASQSNGCLQVTGTLITSTGSACGAGGGGSNWTVGSNFLRTSTTTDYVQAAYYVASSTTGTSTFAGKVGIGTTTLPATFAMNVIGGASRFGIGSNYFVDLANTATAAVFTGGNNTITIGALSTALSTTNPGGINAILSNNTYAGDFTGPLRVTGIAGETANVFTVASSSNTGTFVVRASGNVGVGTSTPTHKLSVIGDYSGEGNLFMGNSLRAPQLNAFGSGVHQVQIATSSNDITGATFMNMSTGSNAGYLINFGNASSTLGGAGINQRFNANIVFSGPNYDGAPLGTRSLRPNSLAMFASDGDFTMAVSTSSPTAALNWQIGSTTFSDWAPDMRMDYFGNLSLGWATTTAPARFAIRGRFGSNDVLFDVASSTSTGFATSTVSSFLKVLANGRVGISSSSPSHTLTLAGDFNGTGALRFNGLAGNQGSILMSNGSSAPTWIATSTLGIPRRMSFSYSTTTWSGTTTIALAVAFNAQTMTTAKCFTDTGTLAAQVTDGTNKTNSIALSTTVGAGTTLSTNNAFTAGEKRYIEIGSPASSPTLASCTIEFYE